MRVVSQTIGSIHDLRFEERLGPASVRLDFRGVRTFTVNCQGLAYFPGEIQTREGGITLFQQLHEPQTLTVMLETAMFFQALLQCFFPRVTKGGVPQVV